MGKQKPIHPTRIFSRPDQMEQAFKEYKADLKLQGAEWLKVQYVGKEGERKADPMKVPMTLEGFERFARNKYGCIGHYFDNKDQLYDDFVAVCSHIRKEIRENQIIGGLMGVYNPSITQRLNGLVEKQQLNVKKVGLDDDEEYTP